MSLMFKEETPSPTNIAREQLSPPRGQWIARQSDRMGMVSISISITLLSSNTSITLCFIDE